MNAFKTIMNSPIHDFRSTGFIIFIAIIVIFVPVPPLTDWLLNAQPLVNGLDIYENPNYVYPPWSLILLWPYYALNVAGTRIASVLIIAFVAYQRGWSLGRFLSIVLSPIFLNSVAYTNFDLVMLSLPIILWDYLREKRFAALLWGLLLALMLLKPQGSWLVIAYFFWQERQRWRELGLAMLVAGFVIVPVSLLASPPLWLQWLDNVLHPSQQNQHFWQMNNLSLNHQFGFVFAALILMGSFGTLAGLMYWRGKRWTLHHSWGALLFASMFLSPYSSLQSTIAPFAFLGSWPTTILQFLFAALTASFGTVALPQLWLLLLVLLTLWFAPNKPDVEIVEQEEVEISRETLAV